MIQSICRNLLSNGVVDGVIRRQICYVYAMVVAWSVGIEYGMYCTYVSK